jgi:excisionase family DNA binding protein
MNERRDSSGTMRDSTPPHLISARVAARLSGEVMDINELGAFLRFSRSKIKRLIKAGTIPGEKIGDSWRFRRDEILALWDKDKEDDVRHLPQRALKQMS